MPGGEPDLAEQRPRRLVVADAGSSARARPSWLARRCGCRGPAAGAAGWPGCRPWRCSPSRWSCRRPAVKRAPRPGLGRGDRRGRRRAGATAPTSSSRSAARARGGPRGLGGRRGVVVVVVVVGGVVVVVAGRSWCWRVASSVPAARSWATAGCRRREAAGQAARTAAYRLPTTPSGRHRQQAPPREHAALSPPARSGRAVAPLGRLAR